MINADALGGQVGALLSHNVFAYCSNNPVNFADPSGYRQMWIGDVATVISPVDSTPLNSTPIGKAKILLPSSSDIICGAGDTFIGEALKKGIPEYTTKRNIVNNMNYSKARAIAMRAIPRGERDALIPLGGLKGFARDYGSGLVFLGTISFDITAYDNYSRYHNQGTATVYEADGIDSLTIVAGIGIAATLPVDAPVWAVGGCMVVASWALSSASDFLKTSLFGPGEN